MQPTVTTDTILNYLKNQVESKRVMNDELWQDAAFKLEILLGDEHTLMEEMRQNVAQKKLEILKAQDKRNVSLADAEIEASDDYRMMRLQEHKVDRIEEFVKLCKKNMSKF